MSETSQKIRRSWPRWLAWIGLAWFGWLMLRITWEYRSMQTDAGFLAIKQQYLGIRPWMLAFWVHVFTSMFVLLAGFTQFAPGVLRKWPALHRWMGRAYVYNVLLITGPASLVMARYANGGWPSRIAFGTLGVLWWTTTFLGLRRALQGRWKTHRQWMIRSYALTLSALTLRAWKVVLAISFHPSPMELYRTVAWLGFIPNLIFAEWWIRRHSTPTPLTSAPSA